MTVEATKGSGAVDPSQGVGLAALIHGINKAVMQQALLMVTNSNIMQQLADLITQSSDKLAGTSKALMKTTEMYSKVNTIATAVMIVGGLSFMDMEALDAPTKTPLQKFHGMMVQTGQKEFIYSNVPVGTIGAYYSMKKGKLSSQSIMLTGVGDTLKAVEEGHENTWNSNSQTLQQITKAEKKTIENDFASKVR